MDIEYYHGDPEEDTIHEIHHVTGAGLMDCKKALDAAGGSFDRAVGLIRRERRAVVIKRRNR